MSAQQIRTEQEVKEREISLRRESAKCDVFVIYESRLIELGFAITT